MPVDAFSAVCLSVHFQWGDGILFLVTQWGRDRISTTAIELKVDTILTIIILQHAFINLDLLNCSIDTYS